jgi:hypothetical protein
MKNELLALMTDRPDDIDWSILDIQHPAVAWVKEYYNLYNQLPTLELFKEECLPEGEDGNALAPWSYYVRQHNDLIFVQEAQKYLQNFNTDYIADPKKAILNLRSKFQLLSEPSKSLDPVDVAKEVEGRWARFKAKKGTGIKTGIEPFDEVSGGLDPDDEFLILSARLGAGKSFVAHFIALNMAMQGLNVGIYSGEMSEDQVGARIDTWLTHISNWNLTRGRLQSGIEEQIKAYEEKVKGRILILTPKQLGRMAAPTDMRKFIKECNLTALVIDQLSLMVPDGKQYQDLYQQFGAISTQLRTIQSQERIPFIAVSQLNRAAEGADPNASNLSGSDKIGQDATCVLVIERSKDKSEVTIKCAKAREYSVPPKGWSFTWDIDTGVLSYMKTAIDGIKAKSQAAKKADAVIVTQEEDSEEDFG